MGTKNFLYLGMALAILFSLSAMADGVSGKTADGCTYKVINGQYLTSCPDRSRASGATRAAEPAGRPTYVASNAAPVTSYGDVPVRNNAYAAPPSLPPQQPNQAYAPVSSIERESAPSSSYESEGRDRFKARLLDQTYVGLQVGASNMKESNAGSTTGFGLDIGTNIDDTFGVELGYSYAKQGLNLGLASRGSSVDPAQQNQGYAGTVSSSDASLSSNLFTGEVQAYLTDPVKRLRPYLGAGLGWRSATLSENASSNGGYQQSTLNGGALRQNSFGGLAAAGTKLRLTKAVSLGFLFRYFFPIARQEARLEQPVASNYGASAPQTKLSGGDDTLTGSSQYQVLGGVQYAF